MLSRREVLTATVAAGAGLATASQASQSAKAQPAGRIIVDGQVHIWLAHTPERPWPADGIGQAHIPRPFSYYELLARMDEAGVDRLGEISDGMVAVAIGVPGEAAGMVGVGTARPAAAGIVHDHQPLADALHPHLASFSVAAAVVGEGDRPAP
jgi:hypothetical protein